jgi:hypothetical protein
MTNETWRQIEGSFRLWSFHVYYEKSFAEETDVTVRFVKALLASCRPIRDRNAVIQWHRKHRRRYAMGRRRRRHAQTLATAVVDDAAVVGEGTA